MFSLKEKEKLLKANTWRVSQFGTISLIKKQYKNTSRRVLFLLKLQVLHNTPTEVFLTLLNEANCPKSQEKIACVKRKPHAL